MNRYSVIKYELRVNPNNEKINRLWLIINGKAGNIYIDLENIGSHIKFYNETDLYIDQLKDLMQQYYDQTLSIHELIQNLSKFKNDPKFLDNA